MLTKTSIKQTFLNFLILLMSFVIILSSDTMYSLNNGYIILEIVLAGLFVLIFLIDPLWNITYSFLRNCPHNVTEFSRNILHGISHR